MTPKLCRYCQKPLACRSLERASVFAKRKYCDVLCARKAGRDLTLRPIVEVELRRCPECGDVIPRHNTRWGRPETPARYAKRKYCSVACAGRHANRAAAAHCRGLTHNRRSCQLCGAAATQRVRREKIELFCDRCAELVKGWRQTPDYGPANSTSLARVA